MIKSYPEFPVARWFLGLSLIAGNEPERAKAEIRRAIQMGYRFRGTGERNVVKELFGDKDFNELV
jgi:hypothetical protein